jgi:L-alanine-DL-glutamate epimerase-like enolase superfamily enzyme
MKITSVEIFDAKSEQTFMNKLNPILIRVNTDEGISGLGEVGLAFGIGRDAGIGYVKDIAEAFLLSSDPMRIEKIWETLFRKTFWALGGGPVIYGGLSAVDEACWDIKGKAMGAPIYQLLGGKTNEKLRAYASQLQFGWDTLHPKPAASIADYSEQATKAISQGYNAVKLNPLMFDESGNPSTWNNYKILPAERVKMVYSRMKAVRDIIGPGADIILETHAMLSDTTAIQIGQELENLNIMYYEEPTGPLNQKIMKKVAENVKIPLASGERIYTRWGFRPFIEEQILAVIQPDIQLAGGISEGKKICDYANIYDIAVQLHVCGGPVATAAALQLEAVIPNFIIHEQIKAAEHPDNAGLIEQELLPQNGYFYVPDEPGLGISLNEHIMQKYQKIVIN